MRLRVGVGVRASMTSRAPKTCSAKVMNPAVSSTMTKGFSERPRPAIWPATTQRPWREVGPVFVHLEPCEGYDPGRGLPDFIRGGRRVLRSYTADQEMHYAGNRITGPDDDLDTILQALLADPQVAELHLRNVEAQCFNARATR